METKVGFSYERQWGDRALLDIEEDSDEGGMKLITLVRINRSPFQNISSSEHNHTNSVGTGARRWWDEVREEGSRESRRESSIVLIPVQ